nr:low-density lipoprotein receptor-related protein 4-like [Lytechinus pictus]
MAHQGIYMLVLVGLSLGIQGNLAQIFIGDDSTPGILYASLPEPRDDSNILETQFTMIPLRAGNTVSGIDYDPNNQMVYWNDFPNGMINRINIDGNSPQELIILTQSPNSIALDLLNGKIYWTMFNDGAISRANLDGSSVQEVYRYLNSPAMPTSILTDSINGGVFWTAHFPDEIVKATQAATTNTTILVAVKPISADVIATEVCADQTVRLFYFTNYTKLGFTDGDGSSDRTLDVFPTFIQAMPSMSKYGSKLFWIGMQGGPFNQQAGIYEYDMKNSSLNVHNPIVTLTNGSELVISPQTAKIISTTQYDEPVVIEGCPENIDVAIDDDTYNVSDSSSPVSWTEPGLNSWSSCSEMDFLGPGTNGGIFLLGKTQVSYTARDAAGNTDTCEFTVTVRKDDDDDDSPCAGRNSGVTLSSCTGLRHVFFILLFIVLLK